MIRMSSINISLIKKIFVNLFIFIIITSIFINYVHKVYKNDKTLNIESTIASEQNNYKKNKNFKTNISKFLASEEKYKIYLNRECEVTGSMDDRKKVRWVIEALMYKLYNFLLEINILLPYYFQILLFSTLIFLSFIIVFKTFPIGNEYKYFFLFFIAFVFQHHLGEFKFSIFEMFFLSFALFASKTKNFLLFLISILLATLNRESGILISLTWFIFNTDYKKFLYTVGITISSFVLLNFDIFACLLNPKFFVPLENQYGQFNFSEIGKSIGYLSAIKVIFINFIIPFGFSYYIYFTTKNKNKIISYMLLIYLLVFLFVLPAHHIAPRLILLPLIIGLIYFKTSNKVKV